ncbi:MAG: SMC-Scp complex subunit ScpB [Planctomycetaceae bacterium]
MSDEDDNSQFNADDDQLSMDDIELAYREALKSLDDAERQVGSALMELARDDSNDESFDEENAFTSIGNDLADDLAANPVADTVPTLSDGDVRTSPREVIEGALFVGGDVALTARRLASLIGQDTETRLAAKLIDQLNADYAEENRPYEIRLHEGGFQLQLREDFIHVAMSVFGLGPREVRLSPEVLEVLAYVAYNQPVTKADLTELSQSSALTLVRQLLQLQLVEVERTGSRRSDIAYRTGERFLKLFELESIDDLPQADVFNFK